MRKEKILEILENAKDGNGAVPMRLVRTAFDKLPEPCEDTISRQAAVDAARKCSVKEVTPAYMLIDKAEIMTELMMLPSAQPDLQLTCNQLATDTISRQAAIGLYEQFQPYIAVKAVDFGKALEQLPSAQPELEQKILTAGYEGKEIRIYIGGRLFAIRELAQ